MKIDESSSFSNLKRKNYFRFFSLSILFLFFSASLSVFSNSSQQESDYIIIKSEKTAQDLFADANHLVSEGEYIKALPIYNYAYDIAKDKQLKKEIIIAKRKAERLLEKKLAEKRKQGQEKIRVLYQQAKQAYSDNNFDRAESLFQQILEIDPNHSVAENFINQHIPAKRQQLKAQAQSQKERQARLAKEKAEKEARQKKLVAERKAEEAEQQAQRAKQEKINSLYHQAKVAYSNNNLNQAESIFKQILTVDPNHKIADAYLNRHLPNKRQQLKEAAQREKERQAELARREAEQQKQEKINNLYHQAKVYYTQRKLYNAEIIFKQILEIDPGHSGAKAYLEKIEIIRERKEQ